MDGRAHNVSAVLRLLFGFVVLSTVAGLLMAGLAIPAVGATGQVAKGGVDFFNDLPSEFTVSPLAQQSRILDADGKLIANPYDENRIIVPLKKISKNMQNAQIAIEDARFYEHGGLDVRGFSRALLSNLQGGDVQGASTLTQQFVKITLQENALKRGDKDAAKDAIAKTYSRKLQELKYALNVEENFTKDQILEGYLNLVYYGDQAYGVEAAALNYFGVPPASSTSARRPSWPASSSSRRRTTPSSTPRPRRRAATSSSTGCRRSAWPAPRTSTAAKKVAVKKMIKKKPAKGVCHRSAQPYFCAYVIEYLQKSPQMAVLGKTPADRLKTINQGGLTIRTTLKPAMQKAAQKEITKAVPVGNKQNLGAAATIVEPGTGKILAMAQATDFDKVQTNVNVDQKYGGGEYGYQFGSTAKVFGLVTALEKGMPLKGTIKVPFADGKKGHLFTDKKLYVDKCGANEPWPVKNDYPSGGKMMTLGEGIAKSINTWAAQLVINVGAVRRARHMTKMGLHKGNGEPIDPYISDIALGSGTTNPMSLASAYATLARAGSTASRPDHLDHDARQEGDQGPGPAVQAGHLRRRGRRRHLPAQGHPRVRYGGRQLGQQLPPRRGQDGHDREAQPELVRGLHPAAGDRGVDRQPQGREQERQALLPEREVLRRLRLHPSGLRWHRERPGVVEDHEAPRRRGCRSRTSRTQRQHPRRLTRPAARRHR